MKHKGFIEKIRNETFLPSPHHIFPDSLGRNLKKMRRDGREENKLESSKQSGCPTWKIFRWRRNIFKKIDKIGVDGMKERQRIFIERKKIYANDSMRIKNENVEKKKYWTTRLVNDHYAYSVIHYQVQKSEIFFSKKEKISILERIFTNLKGISPFSKRNRLVKRNSCIEILSNCVINHIANREALLFDLEQRGELMLLFNALGNEFTT